MSIYVEITIGGSLERLWHLTQEPALHQRWDLRFTAIDYLPRPDLAQPQRFRYRTRIGFGLGIEGAGETRGERSRPDGTRTSALTFWSDDWKSLIAPGSGYWEYVPVADGVRFLTRYDYRTRGGPAGRAFDRLLFRPLIGWATAWSFDRLRLWIERGIAPELAFRRSAVHGGLRLVLAGLWFAGGPALLWAIGAALLLNWRARWIWAALAGLLAITLPYSPAPWWLLGALALCPLGYLSGGDLPSAGRCRCSATTDRSPPSGARCRPARRRPGSSPRGLRRAARVFSTLWPRAYAGWGV